MENSEPHLEIITDDMGDTWASMTLGQKSVREKLPRYMQKASAAWQEVTLEHITKSMMRKLGLGKHKYPEKL